MAVSDKAIHKLGAQMAECEANYARLMKLMPNIDKIGRREFMVQLPSDHTVMFRLDVIERCKYTTMLTFSQLNDSFNGQLDWAPAPHFSLRVYHDAQMAEVSSFQHHHRLRSEYSIPNQSMYHRDERRQLNQLLGEWLKHCLRYGHVVDTINCQ